MFENIFNLLVEKQNSRDGLQLEIYNTANLERNFCNLFKFARPSFSQLNDKNSIKVYKQKRAAHICCALFLVYSNHKMAGEDGFTFIFNFCNLNSHIIAYDMHIKSFGKTVDLVPQLQCDQMARLFVNFRPFVPM